MKKKIAWLIFACWLLMISVCVAKPLVEVNVGIDEFIEVGALTPIHISIKTNELPIDGVINLQIGNSLYKIEAELGPNTKKDYSIEVVLSRELSDIRVQLQQGKEILEQVSVPLHFIKEKTLVVGILSDDKNGFQFLNAIESSNKQWYGEVQTTNLTVEQLEKPQILENLDYIILYDYSTQPLSEKADKSLTTWIKQGHTLFIQDRKMKQAHQIGQGYKVPINQKETLNKVLLDTYLSVPIVEPLDKSQGIVNTEMLYPLVEEETTISKRTIGIISITLGLYVVVLIACISFKKGKSIGKVSLLFLAVILAMQLTILREATVYAVEIRDYNKGIAVGTTKVVHQGAKQKYVVDAEYIDTYGAKNVDVYLDKKQVALDLQGDYLFYTQRYIACCEEENKVEIEKDIVKGMLKNPLADTIENSYLLIGHTLIPLGDIRGREDVSLAYQLTNNLKELSEFNYFQTISQVAHLTTQQRTCMAYYMSNMLNENQLVQWIGFSKEEDLVDTSKHPVKRERLVMHVMAIELTGKDQYILSTGCIMPDGIREHTVQQGEPLYLFYPVKSNVEVKEIGMTMPLETGKVHLKLFNQLQQKWEEVNNLEHIPTKVYCGKGPLSIEITGEGRILTPQITQAKE